MLIFGAVVMNKTK